LVPATGDALSEFIIQKGKNNSNTTFVTPRTVSGDHDVRQQRVRAIGGVRSSTTMHGHSQTVPPSSSTVRTGHHKLTSPRAGRLTYSSPGERLSIDHLGVVRRPRRRYRNWSSSSDRPRFPAPWKRSGCAPSWCRYRIRWSRRPGRSGRPAAASLLSSRCPPRRHCGDHCDGHSLADPSLPAGGG
jgi:hypothetical protein